MLNNKTTSTSSKTDDAIDPASTKPVVKKDAVKVKANAETAYVSAKEKAIIEDKKVTAASVLATQRAKLAKLQSDYDADWKQVQALSLIAYRDRWTTGIIDPQAKKAADLALKAFKEKYPNGRPIKLAKGGFVPSIFKSGGYAQGTDTVPAMLTPGEYVLRKDAVKKYGVKTLDAMNVGYYKDGGSVLGGISNLWKKIQSNPAGTPTGAFGIGLMKELGTVLQMVGSSFAPALIPKPSKDQSKSLAEFTQVPGIYRALTGKSSEGPLGQDSLAAQRLLDWSSVAGLFIPGGKVGATKPITSSVAKSQLNKTGSTAVTPETVVKPKKVMPEKYAIDYDSSGSLHTIKVKDGDDVAGHLTWDKATGVVEDLHVFPGHLKKGIATAMYKRAQEIAPITHSPHRTPAGDAFAYSIGDPVVPLNDGPLPGYWTDELYAAAKARASARAAEEAVSSPIVPKPNLSSLTPEAKAFAMAGIDAQAIAAMKSADVSKMSVADEGFSFVPARAKSGLEDLKSGDPKLIAIATDRIWELVQSQREALLRAKYPDIDLSDVKAFNELYGKEFYGLGKDDIIRLFKGAYGDSMNASWRTGADQTGTYFSTNPYVAAEYARIKDRVLPGKELPMFSMDVPISQLTRPFGQGAGMAGAQGSLEFPQMVYGPMLAAQTPQRYDLPSQVYSLMTNPTKIEHARYWPYDDGLFGGVQKPGKFDPKLLMAQGGLVPKYFAAGGFAQGTDTVPAMLTPGEFIMSKYAVDAYGLGNMKKINKGDAVGGTVYNNTYELTVNAKTNANPNEIAQAVMSTIRQVDDRRIRGVAINAR